MLVHIEQPADDGTAQATGTTTKGRMIGLLRGDTAGPGVDVAGDEKVLPSLLGVLRKGDPSFAIVTP